MPATAWEVYRAGYRPVVDTSRILLVFFRFRPLEARGSVVERFLDTEEVGGSIPPAPTIAMVAMGLPVDWRRMDLIVLTAS